MDDQKPPRKARKTRAPRVLEMPAEGAPGIEYKPTKDSREMVEKFAGLGVPHSQICTLVGCTEKTLAKYYADELARGKAKANGKVTEKLMDLVDKGNPAATFFWLKCQAGWKERQVIEHAGDSGASNEEIQGAADRFLSALFTGGKKVEG